MGDAGEPGPVYIEIPTDVLRTHVPPQLVLDEWMRPKPRAACRSRTRRRSQQAVDAFWSAKRPLVITGRGARGASAELVRLLDATGALYLDTQESRGLVPADHPSTVAAMRAAAMTDADVVLLIGRKLDYQVGYGSPAVFPQRALHPHRRQRRRAHRQSARPAGAARRARRSRSPQWSRRRAIASPASTRPGRTGCGAATASAWLRRGGEAAPADRRRRQDSSARRSSTPSPRSPIPTTSGSPTAAIS